MAAFACHLRAVARGGVWIVIERRAHRPRKCGSRCQSLTREPELVTTVACGESRRRPTAHDVACRTGAGAVAAREASLLGWRRERVTARAAHRVLAVVERGAELGALGRQSIGHERSPRLGGVVARTADRRRPVSEVVGMARYARLVSRLDHLARLGDRMTADTRELGVGVCRVGITRGRTRDLEPAHRRAVALAARRRDAKARLCVVTSSHRTAGCGRTRQDVVVGVANRGVAGDAATAGAAASRVAVVRERRGHRVDANLETRRLWCSTAGLVTRPALGHRSAASPLLRSIVASSAPRVASCAAVAVTVAARHFAMRLMADREREVGTETVWWERNLDPAGDRGVERGVGVARHAHGT